MPTSSVTTRHVHCTQQFTFQGLKADFVQVCAGLPHLIPTPRHRWGNHGVERGAPSPGPPGKGRARTRAQAVGSMWLMLGFSVSWGHDVPRQGGQWQACAKREGHPLLALSPLSVRVERKVPHWLQGRVCSQGGAMKFASCRFIS